MPSASLHAHPTQSQRELSAPACGLIAAALCGDFIAFPVPPVLPPGTPGPHLDACPPIASSLVRAVVCGATAVARVHVPASSWLRSSHVVTVMRPGILLPAPTGGTGAGGSAGSASPVAGAAAALTGLRVCSLGDVLIRDDELPIATTASKATQVRLISSTLHDGTHG